MTNHVGKLQSRCLNTLKCSPTDISEAKKAYRSGVSQFQQHEVRKPFPQRYPWNTDSIGIELVGVAYGGDGKSKAPVFEDVTDHQNASLRWLIRELVETLGVSLEEVYRHSEAGRKNKTEASTAKWE